MLHPLPLPLSSCLGCIPPLIGLPSLRFYAVGSILFLLSVCFCLCSLFYRDDVLCWLLLARPFLYAFHAHLRFPVDLVWFRLSCDHGWIRSGSVNVRKQQTTTTTPICSPSSETIDSFSTLAFNGSSNGYASMETLHLSTHESVFAFKGSSCYLLICLLSFPNLPLYQAKLKQQYNNNRYSTTYSLQQ